MRMPFTRFSLLFVTLITLSACTQSVAQDSRPLGMSQMLSTQATTPPTQEQTASSIPVEINNGLSACLSVQMVRQQTHKNVIQQVLSIQLQQAIGACACTSAQLSVYSEKAETFTQAYTLPLAQTTLMVKQSGEYVVRLGSTKELAARPALVLSMRCQGPR